MSANDDGEMTRITKKGQVTVPKRFREEYGLEPGDELVWADSKQGIVVRKATRSAGRGMLVDSDVHPETRAEMAEEMAAFVREQRRTEWTPE